MTLSFSTKFPSGKPTYFVQKVWQSIWEMGDYRHEFECYFGELLERKITPADVPTDYMVRGKLHTIRADAKDRWKQGNNIHFVINNRTKNRFQFAPILPVKSLQRISIRWLTDELTDEKSPWCWIDGECFAAGFEANNWEKLAINDGFDNVEDFFNWFSEDFTGKIIHWTEFKYS